MSGFLFSFLSGIELFFSGRSLRKIGKSAQEVVIWDKEPPVGGKACIRGDELGERTSCGWKSLYERKQVGRKDLLWNKEYIQEEITIEKEPPMG